MKIVAVFVGLFVGMAAFASEKRSEPPADLTDHLQNAECTAVIKNGKNVGYDCSGANKDQTGEDDSGLAIKDDDVLVPAKPKQKKPLSEKAKKAKEEIESKAFIPQVE